MKVSRDPNGTNKRNIILSILLLFKSSFNDKNKDKTMSAASKNMKPVSLPYNIPDKLISSPKMPKTRLKNPWHSNVYNRFNVHKMINAK